MARNFNERTAPGLADGFAAPPLFWLVILSLGLPWVRVELGGWNLYPLAIGTGLLLAVMVLSEGGIAAALRALLPGLLLGVFVAGMAVLRGHPLTALVVGGATILHFAWGAAAFRLGQTEGPAESAARAVTGLLGAALVVGLAGWLVQGLWPAGCRVLNCGEAQYWPFPFQAGFHSTTQYLLLLLLAAPLLGVNLLYSMEPPKAPRRTLFFAGLAALSGLALVAGVPLWGLLVLLAAGVLWGSVLLASGRPASRLLLKGAGFGLAFALVFVYGLAPEYAQRLLGGAEPEYTLRVAPVDPQGTQLSSLRTAPVTLRVVNGGWRSVGGEGSQALSIGARLLITPKRGPIRMVDLPGVPLVEPLRAGETRLLELPLRLPAWFRQGYLLWRAEQGPGRQWIVGGDAAGGQRIFNPHHRRLSYDPENRLSALAGRARAFFQETRPVDQPNGRRPRTILGPVLDTLFFSPLWGGGGISPHWGSPFSPDRPFLPEFFRQFGLLGLLLGGWFLWRIFSRAVRIAEGSPGPAGLTWRLFALSLGLVVLLAVYSPVPGTYHAHWALFLLAGFVEGRHARLHPSSRALAYFPYRFRIALPRLHLPGRIRRRSRQAS